MDNIELSKKLRWISAKDSSTFRRTICKMAAQRIDKQAAGLAETKALLATAVSELKETDVNCAYCAHKQPPAPCAEDDEHYDCNSCKHDCYCKDCKDNNKWEYEKLKEFRR